MSIYLNQAAVTLFDTQVHTGYQEGYDLRGLVREKSVDGAATVSFPVMGKAIARQKAIHTDVVPADVTHAPVTATMQDWYAADYTDIFAKKKVNFDEVSELANILKMGCGRRIDNILITALNAATPAATISTDIGGSGTDMNYEKFLEIMGGLDDGGVPQDGRTLVMNHRSYRSLLKDPEFISSDYGQMRLDQSSKGNVKPFLAFNIVTINDRVESDGTRLGLPKSGDVVTAFGFHRDAVGMGFNMELSSEVNYVPTKLAYLTTCKFSAGAVAIDGDGIVKASVTQA